MIIDFWNTNLNPITLFTKFADVREKTSRLKTESYRTYVTEDLADNEDYIMIKDAQKMYGLGGQKLREEAQAKGANFKVYTNKKLRYYLKADLEMIEIVVAKKFTIPDTYISGADLRGIKGWTGWDLHSKASKNNWEKKRFKGNVTYYLKSEVL